MRRMFSRLGADRIAAILFLIVFAAYGLAGAQIQSALAVDLIGPGFFPKLVAICGVAVAILLLVQSRPTEAETVCEPDWPALASAGLFLVYIVALFVVGFALATAIFLAIMFKLMGCPGRLRPAAYALVATAGTVLLFRYGLDVRLPAGWLVNI